MLRIGIDTGGTFTDFHVADGDRILSWKEPSTPADPSSAIFTGLAALAARITSAGGAEIIHGSTVATNALLEGKTARIAFITNRGFEDLLEIGRQNRPALYDLNVERPVPLVPAALRFGVSGRLDHAGREIEPLDRAAVRSLATRLKADGVESAAVCLLHSCVNAAHEDEVAGILESAGLSVTASARLVPEYREYERGSTAAVNAAVAPVVSRYLSSLEQGLRESVAAPVAPLRSLRVMGSNGGALSPRVAGREAARTVLSGPAGGVRAAEHVGRAIGMPRVITIDMGGTSTDVSLIEGTASAGGEAVVAGYPVRIPSLEIHTVGAGGGSIAWRDPGGALRVGPASAGAAPGPACYGRGGPATVTDANLFLGRLDPARFLGGRMTLSRDAAHAALHELAAALGIGLTDTAEGILRVAEATMARAIRFISLKRGHDPADFTLMAFGGAGGLHAAALAASLGMSRVVVPEGTGVFSAFGMTVADVLRDGAATLFLDPSVVTNDALEAIYAPLERAGLAQVRADGVPADRITFERAIDLRYRGQSHELTIPMPAGGAADLVSAFHAEHERLFGYRRAGAPIEIVVARSRTRGRIEPPRAIHIDEAGRSLAHALVQPATYDRDRLPEAKLPPAFDPERTIRGPALVVEAGSTTYVAPGWRAALDALGHLHMWRAD